MMTILQTATSCTTDVVAICRINLRHTCTCVTFLLCFFLNLKSTFIMQSEFDFRVIKGTIWLVSINNRTVSGQTYSTTSSRHFFLLTPCTPVVTGWAHCWVSNEVPKYHCVSCNLDKWSLLLIVVKFVNEIVSVISGEVKMEVDNVDGDQLLNSKELWSDMIVFSSLTPSKLQSSWHILRDAIHTSFFDVNNWW